MEHPGSNPQVGDELVNVNEYIESANRLAKNRSDFVFTSASPVNAAIVMAIILKYSENEVRIYDNCIDGEIADQHTYFFNALDEFFREGKKLKIVVRKESENDSKILEALANYEAIRPSQLDVRLASQEFKENISGAVQTDTNFIVNDQNGFRMEVVDLENPNENIKQAFSSFNKQDISEKLVTIFDQKFSTCTELQFPAHA